MTSRTAERMRRLKVRTDDLEESFARSSGPGGQHVNKVSTAVTLKHRPSGVSLTVQDSRSQARNRALALERLLDALERQREEKRAAERAAASQQRRRNSPRPPRLKRKILEQKRNRSQLKKLRANRSIEVIPPP
ncbi:MAG: peptide chain release factor-like protein [Chthoniobacterales bacterium]|nr:peptide chain release factor-like protein [Chthoniobacterales bacterium]